MEQHKKTPWAIHPKGLVVDAEGAAVCTSYHIDMRRIVACVNACEGIPTELLKQGAGFWEKSNLHDEERDAAFAYLLRENARLLEALKWTVENLQEASRLTDSEGGDYTEVYLPVINAANIAIAEAEKTTAP